LFTGIVEELGEIVRTDRSGDSARITVRGPLVTSDAERGSSIAVNGVCLTVVDLADGGFTADVMLETLRRTSLGSLLPGSPVNLERPLAASGRFGGHIVQGHVDGIGRVVQRGGESGGLVRISVPGELAPFLVQKGSITVDGVSLTVVDVDDAVPAFTVSLIPETLTRTTLGHRSTGDAVNLEVDVLAKYVQRLLQPAAAQLTPSQAQLDRLIEAEGVRR
jgi:riboflavin synthase